MRVSALVLLVSAGVIMIFHDSQCEETGRGCGWQEIDSCMATQMKRSPENGVQITIDVFLEDRFFHYRSRCS